MKSAIELITEIPVIYRPVIIGKAKRVPLKKRLKQLGKRRCDQTPDAEIDKILIQLGSGSKASSKLTGKPHKPDTQSNSQTSLCRLILILCHNCISISL